MRSCETTGLIDSLEHRVRALTIWGKFYGQENPWLSADLSNLAVCYENLKDFGDAELALQRAVHNDEKGL